MNGECLVCPETGCGQMGNLHDLYALKSGAMLFFIKYIGFHSISSPGRGNMYLTTKSVSPFCGKIWSIIELSSFLLNNIIYLGYHYLVEVTLDHNIAKTSGEIFVAIHSNYEMLANVSVTSKYVRIPCVFHISPFFFFLKIQRGHQIWWRISTYVQLQSWFRSGWLCHCLFQ